MVKHKVRKLKFTGERLIPEMNRGTAFYFEHLARYYLATQFCKNKNVLDIACGTGYGSRILKKRGMAKSVVGVDISKETIKYASVRYKTNGVRFLVDDATKQQKLNNLKFDVVVSFETLEHLKKNSKFIELICEKLNPGGIFIVSTPNTLTYPEGNPYHQNEMDPDDFSDTLKKYFSKIETLTQKFYLTQVIRKNETDKRSGFIKSKETSYIDPSRIEDCEYLIAICSNQKIPKIRTVSISVNKVDSFDLKNGMLTLSKQFSDMHEAYISTNNMLVEVESKLKNLRSSKIYKFWLAYKGLRGKFLNHEN